MPNFIAFLHARLRELESSDWHHRNCQTHRTMPPNSPRPIAGTPMACTCNVPQILRADVASKRKILTLHKTVKNEHRPNDQPLSCRSCGMIDGWYDIAAPCDTLKSLSLPYVNHPDYNPAWLPTPPRHSGNTQ